MKAPVSDKIPDIEVICAYFSSHNFLDRISTPGFEQRCSELFDRIEIGEFFTLEDAAEMVGLPWPVMGYLLLHYSPKLFAMPQVRRRIN
ncbi:MAG: hypothetical protein GXP04_12295 [Alphaproteobacteria bacterium]|nr:hypothetical protein [Alphaproteobacteria bacterium]